MMTSGYKAKIRSRHQRLRQELSKEQVEMMSRKICDTLMQTEIYIESTTVFAYMALPFEIDLKFLLENALINNKKVVIPKVLEKRHMEFFEITSLEDVEVGRFNVREPIIKEQEPVNFNSTSIMIVPGLAYDFKGFRIGYGGGFYDQYIEKLSLTKLEKTQKNLKDLIVGVFYSWQQVDSCYPDIYDQDLKQIVTEKEKLMFH